MRMRPASLTAAAPPSSCHDTHSVTQVASKAMSRNGAPTNARVVPRVLRVGCSVMRKSYRGVVAMASGPYFRSQEPKAKNPARGGALDNWRSGWDSNPRYLAVRLISSQVHSTTLPPLLIGCIAGRRPEFYQARRVSKPPRYGRRASGIVTEPSAFWQFSSTATRVRPTASPEPFRVCTNSFLPWVFL